MNASLRGAKKQLFINCLLLVIGLIFCVDIAVFAHLHYTKAVQARNTSQEQTLAILINELPKGQPWKIYVDKTYGFSVKYPFDWNVTQRDNHQIHFYPNDMTFSPDEEGQGVVVVFLYPEETEELIPESYEKQTRFNLNGLQAVRYEGIPGGFENRTNFIITDTMIKRPSGVIGITYFNNQETKNDDDQFLTYLAMVDSFIESR